MTECPSTVMSMTSTTFLTVIVVLYAAGTSGGVACRVVMTARAVVLDESAVTVLEPIEGIEDVFTGVADVRKATPSTSAVAEMSGLTESPSTVGPAFSNLDRHDGERGLERETGVEPATLSLGMRTGSSAHSHGMATSEDRTIGDPNPDARSPGLAAFCTREAPIEPQSIARHVRSAEATQPSSPSVTWPSNFA